jgi:O-acetylhomoserine (thiol)-lyase
MASSFKRPASKTPLTQSIIPKTPAWQRAWRPDTQALHTGYSSSAHQRSAAVPIYQGTSYVFDSAQHGADLFDYAQLGYIYARTGNPTVGVLEQRIAALEGGVLALALASGMAAIDVALGTLAAAGDEVLIASQLYGGTHMFITEVLQSRGVASRIVGKDDFDALAAAITPRTKAVFVESVGNPSGALTDLRRIANIAHAAGVALVVDNTVASPLQIRPFDWGADIVVHSATKVIGGHGNALGGVIVDGGRFDWAAHAERYPQFSTPEPAFRNTVYTERFPGLEFLMRARTALFRNTGAALPAHSAFLLLQGLETLAVRQDRITSNTRRVIAFLQQQAQVARIHHVSLADHPDHALAQRYLQGGGVPGILSFELRGGRHAAHQFYDALRLFLRLINIGDSKSLASIPAETTHYAMSDADLEQAGIAPGLVRLSVGIEHPDDLIDDLRQALAQVTHADAQTSGRESAALAN